MPARLLLVSHLASAHETTGAEQSLLELASGLAALGHPVSWLGPGEGRSTNSPEIRSFADVARVAVDVLDHLGLQKVHLAGSYSQPG